MQAILYQFVLTTAFAMSIATMMQPHRQTQGYMQTLEEAQRAGVEFIGANCAALPDQAGEAQLQEAGNLSDNFDNQGATFTWRLADHPGVSINADGDAGFLAFLAGRTSGGFETDSSYSFVPDQDMTLFRAANNSYNLFAYAANDFSCAAP